MRNGFRLALTFFALLCVPAAAAPEKTVVPPYEKLVTRNGVTVYFFPNPNIPLFEVHLSFQSGSDSDPPDLSGLGVFAAGLTRRGVPGLDENAITRVLDDVAGTVDVQVNEEETGFASYGLNDHAPEINKLLFDVVEKPTFPEVPFRRLKANHLDGIKQLPDSPGGLATHVIDSLIFNGTTKARPTTGFKRDVERITLERAREFYPNLVRTDKLVALVIGGRDRHEILDEVVRRIEALPCPACGRKITPERVYDFPHARAPRGEVVLVDRRGISEAHVRMGFMGPKRDIPEFYDLRVAETILGGHFASRLNLIIREKMNLTYGVSAGFNFGTSTGSFVLATSTRNEKVGVLVTEVKKLLAGFVAGDISDSEIQIAKDYLTGSFPIGLQNVYAISNTFFTGLLSGLDPGFLDRFVPRINGVTPESLKAAIRKYFPLEQMKIVVVGDRKAVAPRLKASGLKYVTRDARQFL